MSALALPAARESGESESESPPKSDSDSELHWQHIRQSDPVIASGRPMMSLSLRPTRTLAAY